MDHQLLMQLRRNVEKGTQDIAEKRETIRTVILGVTSESEQLLLIQPACDSQKTAGRLVRKVVGPILSPLDRHPWESRYVLNAATVRIDNTTYLVYRAFGDDEVSRLGLAWTEDGVSITGRLSTPIFSPANASEKKGCEDPRITVIEDQLYMLYTAYDGKIAQISLASISAEDFISKRFKNWRRHGLAFPGLPNKDAVLYPEKFNGKFAVYHRIDPAMWVSYMNDLTCPFPRDGHKIVIGPRSGMMWDSIKIGAGAQPIKTTKGMAQYSSRGRQQLGLPSGGVLNGRQRSVQNHLPVPQPDIGTRSRL